MTEVFEWWLNGYPYKGDESHLFATEDAADAYRVRRGEGEVFRREVIE